MEKTLIRVRFAPSPTGVMHVGNIRTALFNFLFSRKYHGQFILRIEDTDPERIFDKNAEKIIADLSWLHLAYDEGPHIGGSYTPYFQSKRTHLYHTMLAQLIEQQNVYRCFCSAQLLKEKRERQIALKKPPRYDRSCTYLSSQEITHRLDAGESFIWRFKLDQERTIEIHDLARGTIIFDFAHFSDFPLTRENGSFTFIFANAIDDMYMKITHVLRGEDHLSNTAYQTALYHALGYTLPLFWHMPILCNRDGKKLSKRDFGFSLNDLKVDGFLPEAIVNYLGIIGASFTHEIMDLTELTNTIDFNHIHATGSIKYDVEKLRWINGKWIDRYSVKQLLDVVLPFLIEAFPQAATIPQKILHTLVKLIQPEMTTLKDVVHLAQFYFIAPSIDQVQLETLINDEEHTIVTSILEKYTNELVDPNTYLKKIRHAARHHKIPIKLILTYLRVALTGQSSGPQLQDVMDILGPEETHNRLQAFAIL